jgi:hypothetical protein
MARKKIAKKSTKTQPKPGAKRGRRPRIKVVVAQPEQAPSTEAPEPEQLVKVNSAIVRRRQKARAAGRAAPTKAVPAPAATTSKVAKAGTSKPRTKRGRKIGPTTLFVLAQPSALSATDVVKAGAEKGIELNELLVHKVRSRYRDRVGVTARAEPEAATSSVPATVNSAKAVTQMRGSASEFVREQPMEMPTKEVVVAGEKLGLRVTGGIVRVTRFKMRHGGEAKPKAARRGVVRRGRPPKAAVAAGKAARRGRSPTKAFAAAGGPIAAEAQLRRLVVELGTARAMALVDELERAIGALISG